MNQINVKLIQRNDTFKNWESVNPVLSTAEIGVDTTNNKIKVGDGSTSWNDLKYYAEDTDLAIERLKYYGDKDIIPSDESYFTVNETGETITGLTDAGKTQTELVIPYKINGKEITDLQASSTGGMPPSILDGNNVITKVVIPNSVNSIGDFAFKYCPLTSINIPNSVTYIRMNAFNGCTSLTSINIPNSVTSIDIGAFSGCTSLTSINIPNSVTSIGDDAFSGCTNLKIYCEQGNSYVETYAQTNSIPIIYTDISSATINAKANSDDVYTKTEINSKLSSVYRYKGTVENYTSLPTSGLTVGDVYNIENAISPTVSTKYAIQANFENAYTTGSGSNLTYVYGYYIDKKYTHFDSTEFYIYLRDKQSDLYEVGSVSFTSVEVTEATSTDPEGNVEVFASYVTFKIADSTFEKYKDYSYDAPIYIQEVGSETDSTKGTAIRVADDIMKARVNAGDNVAWTGSEWDILAGTVDLSNYAKKSTTLAGYGITNAYTKTEVNNKIPSYYDIIIDDTTDLSQYTDQTISGKKIFFKKGQVSSSVINITFSSCVIYGNNKSFGTHGTVSYKYCIIYDLNSSPHYDDAMDPVSGQSIFEDCKIYGGSMSEYYDPSVTRCRVHGCSFSALGMSVGTKDSIYDQCDFGNCYPLAITGNTYNIFTNCYNMSGDYTPLTGECYFSGCRGSVRVSSSATVKPSTTTAFADQNFATLTIS